MKLEMGAPEERDYAHAPTVHPSTTNHQHPPSLQDVGVCTNIKPSKSSYKS